MNAIQKAVEAVTQKFNKPRVVYVDVPNPVHMQPVKAIMAVYAYKPKEVIEALDDAFWLRRLSLSYHKRPPKILTTKYLGTLPKPVLHYTLGRLSKFI